MISPSSPPFPLLRNLLLAILSGILLTLSFPPGHFSFVAWVALVPLLKSIQNASLSKAFRLGLISGLAHYLTLIYWIIVVLKHYGNLNILVALFALLILSLYLSLYVALFSSLASRLIDSPFSPMLMACYWVALEYLKVHLMTGFPWCLLGYTQYEHLHLIQSANLVGVYGISFLIVLVNGFIFRIVTRTSGQSARGLKWDLLIPILLLMATWIYGHYHISGIGSDARAGHRVRAAVIQANIDQSVKWDPAYQVETIETYHRLTRSVGTFHPELIVWPETSLPFFFQDSSRFSPGIISLAKESEAILVFGSPAYKRQQATLRYYNRAYMIDPDTRQIKYYDKMHLVPFGEYVPLKRYLPFINRLVEAAGDFAPGEKLTCLTTGDLSLGILICFEAIFPELARALTRDGATILVNITNDAWFGMTSAPYQHLSMAVFRAVENRRPMIRAANTGFSAFIGPAGAIRAETDLFAREVLTGSVTADAFELTFYSRFGDLFAVSLLLFSFANILSSLWIRRRRRT